MQLKIIGLNMWRSGQLFDNIQAFIAKEQPDILALQEVYHSEDQPPLKEWQSISSLARILGYPHYVFNPAFSAVTEDTAQRVQNGNAILSKFPITSSQSVFYDRPYEANLQLTPGDYKIGRAHV